MYSVWRCTAKLKYQPFIEVANVEETRNVVSDDALVGCKFRL